MNFNRRAYSLTEILVIIVILATLITLSVRPLRTMTLEIPRSVGACQTLNITTNVLDLLQSDIEQAERIVDFRDSVLTLEHNDGLVRYSFADQQITRHPAMNDSGAEYTWQFACLKSQIHLWSQNNQPYAVELTTWNQQNAMDSQQVRFKQIRVFFRKGSRQ